MRAYPSPALPSLARRSPSRWGPRLWRKRYPVLERRFRLRVSSQLQRHRHRPQRRSSAYTLAHELSPEPLVRWRPPLATLIHTLAFSLTAFLTRPSCDAQLDCLNSTSLTRD